MGVSYFYLGSFTYFSEWVLVLILGDDFKSKNFYNLSTVTLPASGEYFQVFVSTSKSPDHFWVQLVSKEATKLDTLTNELADEYGQLKPDEERLDTGMIYH